MAALITLLALGTLAVPEPLAFRADVRIDGEIVRLSDVVDVTDLPAVLRARAAEIPVASLTSSDQILSSRAIAARARAAAPGLSAWLPASPDQPIHVRSGLATLATGALVAPSDAPVVRAGDALTVSVRVGPVVVERDVRALQDGWAGRRVFVRTSEGSVLTAQVTSAQ